MTKLDAGRVRGSGQRRRQIGLTLVETLLGMAIMAIAGGGATILVLRSQGLMVEIDRLQRVDETGLRALQRIAGELQTIDPASLQPFALTEARTCSYQPVVHYVAGAPVLGARTSLGWIPVPGETIDGTDENGDGRVDEGRLVLQVTGQPEVVLAENVLGLALTSANRGVDISLSIGIVNRSGELLQRTFSQRVTFRNP